MIAAGLAAGLFTAGGESCRTAGIAGINDAFGTACINTKSAIASTSCSINPGMVDGRGTGTSLATATTAGSSG
jgi:hypothetical protein